MLKAKEVWFDLPTQYHAYSGADYYEKIYLIKPNMYQISNLGRIRNKRTKNIITVRESHGTVCLSTVGAIYGQHRTSFYNGRLQYSVARLYRETFDNDLTCGYRVAFINIIDTLKF